MAYKNVCSNQQYNLLIYLGLGDIESVITQVPLKQVELQNHCIYYIHQVIFGGRALFENLPALPHTMLKGGRTGTERHV